MCGAMTKHHTHTMVCVWCFVKAPHTHIVCVWCFVMAFCHGACGPNNNSFDGCFVCVCVVHHTHTIQTKTVMAVVVWMIQTKTAMTRHHTHTIHGAKHHTHTMSWLFWFGLCVCGAMSKHHTHTMLVWIVCVWCTWLLLFGQQPWRCLDGVCVVLCHGCFGLDCVCVVLCHGCFGFDVCVWWLCHGCFGLDCVCVGLCHGCRCLDGVCVVLCYGRRCLDGVCVVLCHGCFGLDCVCVVLCHDCCC